MSGGTCRDKRGSSGFTLIEVMGALMIFAVGILMVVSVSNALGVQMRYAGARSELVVMANERLDSLEATPLASLSAGVTTDTLQIEGLEYERVVTVTSVTAVLSRIVLSMDPIDGEGPSFSATSYSSAAW